MKQLSEFDCNLEAQPYLLCVDIEGESDQPITLPLFKEAIIYDDKKPF